METAAYRRSLAVEYASHRENARHDQAEAVLAELERTGGVPAELQDAAKPAGENTSQKAPRERAATKKAAS